MAKYIKRSAFRPLGASKARKFAEVERACLTDDERMTEDDTLVYITTVSDHEPAPTGVLDADGNEFLRLPERIGFHWKD